MLTLASSNAFFTSSKLVSCARTSVTTRETATDRIDRDRIEDNLNVQDEAAVSPTPVSARSYELLLGDHTTSDILENLV